MYVNFSVEVMVDPCEAPGKHIRPLCATENFVLVTVGKKG